MAESQKSVFKKRYHMILAVVAVLGFYATGFINCLIVPRFKGNITLGNIIKAFFATKATFFVFPAVFLLFSGIGVYIVHKSWKESLLDDKMGRKFRYSDKISPYGDAHVMEPHEYVDVAQIRKLEDCKGIIVGQLTEDGKECVDFNAKRINTHMYVTATSGSGKTFGFVKPYVFQSEKRRHSLVVTDPKGELFQDTAGFLQDNGYHVRRLDFKNLEKSDGWDCLKLLRGKNMRTKVQIFSNAVISNINPNDNSIFSKGSDSLLQALILRVLLGHDFKEEDKNIKSVYQLLQNPAGYEFLDTMFDKNSLTEEELPCLAPYLAYKQGSTNLSSNIATHLANGLQLFQDELLCDVLSTDDIDLILPGKEPCAYYCVFPDDHDTYRFVISLFFTMFFIELVDFADDQPDLKLPVPVDFLLDEFPSIGIIPDWAKKMSTIRSRGISAVMITQDFTQLQQNYKETWPTILNNCGALVTLGINEMETAEWISKRIGEVSAEVESSSLSEVGGIKRNFVTKQSIGVGKRSLFTPAEIFEIGKDSNLVIIAGRNPIYSNKTPYTIFPDSQKLRPIKKSDLIDISDTSARKMFRDCENEYVRKFWETHNMKPLGDPSDLSDAMYTEAEEGPIPMILAIIKEDYHSVVSFIKKLLHKHDGVNEVPAKSDEQAKNIENPLSNKTAEKGAFLAFYEQYKQNCAASSASDFSDQPSFEVNEDTGEVSFFDDVAIGEDLLEFDGDFTDADIISSLSSAAQEEGKNEDAAANAANAPEEKKHDDNRTAEEKPRFNSVKKKSSASKVNASQKEADEWMSSKSDFIQPPKSKKTKEN